MKNKSRLKIVLHALIAIFILILAFLFAPIPDDIRRPLFPLAGVLGLVFLVLGIVLLFMARKEKGRLRQFLMLTGISASCPLVFAILHNVFYALGILFEKLNVLFEILHGTSFLIATLISPITFIVGAVGSVLCIKNKH